MQFLRIADAFIEISDISRIQSDRDSATIVFKGSAQSLNFRSQRPDGSFNLGKDIVICLIEEIMNLEKSPDPYKEIRLKLEDDLKTYKDLADKLKKETADSLAKIKELEEIAGQYADMKALALVESQCKDVFATDIMQYSVQPQASFQAKTPVSFFARIKAKLI